MAFNPLSRRDLLHLAGGALAGGLLTSGPAVNSESEPEAQVAGPPLAADAGTEVLRAGGNAVDGIVTAALAAAVVSIHNCGIGGYGGHMVIALPSGKVTAIDFNSTAPAAARPDMFPLDEKGQVKGNANFHGWLAAGVPGTLAGMQLALDRYGTRSFREAVQPAIRYARDGFPINTPLATVLRNAAPALRQDPATAALLLENGEPPKEGATHRNPRLAALLQTLADRGRVDPFYRGDIGRQIADAFSRHGGLVTAADMAAYRAREVKPLALDWNGSSIRTAPLTAGGATVLQALAVLKALDWEKRPQEDPRTTHARLEAPRLCWHDRVTLLGDPDHAGVPLERLLSSKYVHELADRVEAAVAEGKPAPAGGDGRTADGTVHLSAVDRSGMMAALTLTHGSSFGAQVTVEELGLILGHGMSRFDPRPGMPNSPGPHKRPLHNMCPTVVLRRGRPELALGAAGGRRIVNSVFHVLAHYAGRGVPLEAALAAPRLHNEGDLAVVVDTATPEADLAYLSRIGFAARRGAAGATVTAVERSRS